jgi:hypothetical protein
MFAAGEPLECNPCRSLHSVAQLNTYSFAIPISIMSLGSFLVELFEHGRVRVDEPAIASHDELTAADMILRERDAAIRLEFPGDAPDYEPEVALWGAVRFHQACRFAVYREVPAEAIDAAFADPIPVAEPAACHYLVDLTHRFLPDLARLVRTAAAADPLGEHLRNWARQWPLSSVGMSGVEVDPHEPVWEQRGLLRYYVDRIVAAGDVARLVDPRVRRELRRMLGGHEDLAPTLAAALNAYDRQSAGEVAAAANNIAQT